MIRMHKSIGKWPFPVMEELMKLKEQGLVSLEHTTTKYLNFHFAESEDEVIFKLKYEHKIPTFD